ncbi:hypothetical protein CU664_13505 [Pseudomonas syringae pv. actinidifoliorum]|nr:hypothetical protein [Pseudomonas syringae pv. actinidifoliorum]NAT64226.1 hypothetical protein [Pseudomonas syringae pv. actinidifoliorum]
MERQCGNNSTNDMAVVANFCKKTTHLRNPNIFKVLLGFSFGHLLELLCLVIAHSISSEICLAFKEGLNFLSLRKFRAF